MREISGPGVIELGKSWDAPRPPEWFLRELAIIDDRYYVKYNSYSECYNIMVDVEQFVDMEKRIVKIKYPLARAAFDCFDRRVLDNLTKRKWINRHFGSNERYYRWLQAQEKERKAKDKDNADDMITEGIMKIDKVERTKTFT